MKTDRYGKIAFCGIAGFDNPLDSGAYPKRLYAEGSVSARVTFRSIWLDKYAMDASGAVVCCSCELKMLSNGKAFLDGREIRDQTERETAKELFDNIRVET